MDAGLQKSQWNVKSKKYSFAIAGVCAYNHTDITHGYRSGILLAAGANASSGHRPGASSRSGEIANAIAGVCAYNHTDSTMPLLAFAPTITRISHMDTALEFCWLQAQTPAAARVREQAPGAAKSGHRVRWLQAQTPAAAKTREQAPGAASTFFTPRSASFSLQQILPQ